jgi:hypothetical protein
VSLLCLGIVYAHKILDHRMTAISHKEAVPGRLENWDIDGLASVVTDNHPDLISG